MIFKNTRINRNVAPVIAVFITAVCLFSAPTPGRTSQSVETLELLPLPSISATYREFHKGSGTELSKARVYLSPFGMRIEQKIEGVKIAVYHNFMTGQMWFLNHERAVMHEVPLDLSAANQSNGVEETGFRLGFIDTEACSSLDGVKRSNVRWRGRQVSLWDCYLDPMKAVAMQHYDDSIGLVVRSEYVDGVVMQLEDLQDRHFDKSYFVPSKNYRVVSMNELMTGALEIETYGK